MIYLQILTKPFYLFTKKLYVLNLHFNSISSQADKIFREYTL